MSGYESKYIDLEDVTLHMKVAGDAAGEPVILLHGFPEFWYGWRHQIDALAGEGYRVIVPDQRGYNKSSKPDGTGAYHIDKLRDDILGIMDHFGMDQANIAGHDWGGAVGWHLASTRPRRVKKFIAVNIPHPAVMPEAVKKYPKQIFKSLYIGFFQIPGVPEKVLSTGNYRNMARALTASGRKNTFSEEDLDRYKASWSEEGALTGMLNWYRAAPKSISALRKDVPVPTQIIWGTGDQFLSKELAEESFKLLASGDIAWIEAATHWVMHERPEIVNRHMLRFLKK
ncbi:alpha/beta fold hydrolase [Lacicoccus alkaliphilus]|uniref:Pimeloyl-ACP methyl ester carboxylesterase n=1 Tax=Lacicoccus alkaliphilus DSM 16010 TaxID=1123231 RepID=A0A1M7IWT1_9BACL|nr:alpha/beta hydrolase [Salinicoccus alkaliphilus]SHM45148.1 Pimeloyl-ACP methyl ester carboxylesterase [Salinicoccus alkaliphilus DSM 16010]